MSASTRAPAPAASRVRLEEMLWFVDQHRADRERQRQSLAALGLLRAPWRDREQAALEAACDFLGHCLTCRLAVAEAIGPALRKRRPRA
jgi:hypothetical protein